MPHILTEIVHPGHVAARMGMFRTSQVHVLLNPIRDHAALQVVLTIALFIPANAVFAVNDSGLVFQMPGNSRLWKE